jgi:hypothetical protein
MEDNSNKNDQSELTRRQFVGMAASGATVLTILPSFTISVDILPQAINCILQQLAVVVKVRLISRRS